MQTITVRRLSPEYSKQLSFDVDDEQNPAEFANLLIEFINKRFEDEIEVPGTVSMDEGVLTIRSPITKREVIIVAQGDPIKQYINPGTTKFTAYWNKMEITNEDDIKSIDSSEGLDILDEFVKKTSGQKMPASIKTKSSPKAVRSVATKLFSNNPVRSRPKKDIRLRPKSKEGAKPASSHRPPPMTTPPPKPQCPRKDYKHDKKPVPPKPQCPRKDHKHDKKPRPKPRCKDNPHGTTSRGAGILGLILIIIVLFFLIWVGVYLYRRSYPSRV